MKSMDREKQIEEIANILWNIPCNYYLNSYSDCERIAECIYDDGGYRKADEEIDDIKKGMHFLLYSMCLQLNFGREIFVKYKIQINNWFENYKKLKKIGAKMDDKEADAEATEKWNKRIYEEDK